MLDPTLLKQHFDAALPYHDYVATGTADQQKAWDDVFRRAELSDSQRELVGSFTRDIRILVSSGVWCGDCVQQCPFLGRIAEANPDRVHLRLIDRDDAPELTPHLKVCGGTRVPVAVFMAEDFEPVSIFGDRTLARYRAMAARNLGPSCPIPGASLDRDELHATLQDWLDETERCHLILRLSTRLRQKHAD